MVYVRGNGVGVDWLEFIVDAALMAMLRRFTSLGGVYSRFVVSSSATVSVGWIGGGSKVDFQCLMSATTKCFQMWFEPVIERYYLAPMGRHSWVVQREFDPKLQIQS